MFKKLGSMLVLVLGGALLAYSASRSLDFIALTLPADKAILAWFGLAALDGGLIAWALSYLYGSRGGWQRAISLLMVLVDLVGAVAMFTADTLYQTGQSGMTTAMTADQIQTAVLALSGIIALNIAATVAHHLTDPDKLREQAEEEAFAKVEDATLRQISQNADQLASQVAPMLATDWMQNTRARYLANLGTGRIPTIDATSKDLPALPAETTRPAPAPALWAGLFAPRMNAKGSGKKPEPLHAETVMPAGNLVQVTEAAPSADPFGKNTADVKTPAAEN